MPLNTLSFEHDLRSEILGHIWLRDESLRAELTRLETPDLLTRFLIWRDRLIHPHSRSVCKSDQILANPVYGLFEQPIRRVFAKIAVGHDLTQHLSRGIMIGFDRPAPDRLAGRDIDGLLANWGIHHLHISDSIDPDGFVARSKYVLAIIFRDEHAYVLDLIDHTSWAKIHLVEVAVREFADANLFIPLKGVLPGANYEENELQQLRNSGISTSVNVDGQVYIEPYGGISMMATPNRATRLSSKLRYCIRELENSPGLLFKQFASLPRFDRRLWPRSPKYRLLAISSSRRFCFGIKEERTQLMVELLA